MPSNTKEILDGAVDGEKSLGLAGRFELAHLSFSLACGLIRDFGAVVGVAAGVVIHGRQDGSQRRPVAFQFVGNDSERFFPLAPQQSSKESLCGGLIAARLKQDVDHVAVLIHGTPQVLLLAVDPDEDFIQVPDVAEATPTPLQSPGIVRAELLTPVSNCFISDDDAAFGQEIFHFSRCQTRTFQSYLGRRADVVAQRNAPLRLSPCLYGVVWEGTAASACLVPYRAKLAIPLSALILTYPERISCPTRLGK